ncbi:Pre-mRNA cleavage complex II protein Clp1-domain-containing protein [Chytridium lagenaria]|nr:Pre-mRNA cleavage complex II protein Clp1-domain-containing protein [Chytridium lagenaria]
MEEAKTLEWREYKVDVEQELRFEVNFKDTVQLKLKSGFAEIFGTELAPDFVGVCAVEYTAGDTPMPNYLNAHIALEQIRENAVQTEGQGPKVMIVGPSDVGKTSLCKLLLNYAIKWDRKPLFVDIDINEGALSVPGTMSASVLYRPIDIEEEFGGLPHTTGSSPVVFYYGYNTPAEKGKLYDRIVTRVAGVATRKMEDDSEVILVVGHERLYSDLNRQFNDKIAVVKLAKSGGVRKFLFLEMVSEQSIQVVARDKNFRRQLQSAKIREYFLWNGQVAVESVYKYLTLAPSSALPLGMERKLQETRVVKVEAGDILLNSVLAVSNADRLDALPSIGSAPALTPEQETSMILDSALAGFVYVSEVDDAKHKATILTPNPGRLPKKYMIMGSLKWVETS